MVRRFLVVALLITAGVGCNSWERNTFNTLASSKAVIDTAQNDYQAKIIPQSQCAYALINDGKAAQTAAVDAMIVYEQLKASKGNYGAQQVVVANDLMALAPMVAKMQTLTTNPAGCTGGTK